MFDYKEIQDDDITLKETPDVLICDGFIPDEDMYEITFGVKFMTENGTLTLLAKNQKGFAELNKVFKDSLKTDDLPLLSDVLLITCKKDNLILLTDDQNGEIYNILLKNKLLDKKIKHEQRIYDNTLKNYTAYAEAKKAQQDAREKLKIKKEELKGYKTKANALIKKQELEAEKQYKKMLPTIENTEENINLLEEDIKRLKKILSANKDDFNKNKEAKRNKKNFGKQKEDDKILYERANKRLLFLKESFKTIYVEVFVSSALEKQTFKKIMTLAEDANVPVLLPHPKKDSDLEWIQKRLSGDKKFSDIIFNKSDFALSDPLEKYKNYIQEIKAHYGEFDEKDFIDSPNKKQWLMDNFPCEYACVALNFTSQKTDIFRFCEDTGIKILLPDINASMIDFTMEPAKGNIDANKNIFYSIRFGLSKITGVTKNQASSIIEERDRGGKFSSMKDFLLRTSKKEEDWATLKYNVLCPLVEAGCFDTFKINKTQTLKSLKTPLIAKTKKGLEYKLKGIQFYDFKKDAISERKMFIRRLGILPDLEKSGDVIKTNDEITATGVLADISHAETRFGNDMLVLKLWCARGVVTAFAFGEVCKKYSQTADHLLYETVTISGKLNNDSITLKKIAPASSDTKNFLIYPATDKDIDVFKNTVKGTRGEKVYRIAILNNEDFSFFYISKSALKKLAKTKVMLSDADKERVV